MEVTVYTDASHCHVNKIAVCGYIVVWGRKKIKHHLTIVDRIHSSNDAERLSIVYGVQCAFIMKGVTKITVRTDSLNVVAAKILRSDYWGITSDYKETIEMCHENGIPVQVQYVKGNHLDAINREIDKSVRKHLRKYIKDNNLKDPAFLTKPKNAKSWV